MERNKKRNIILFLILISFVLLGCWFFSCLKSNFLFKKQESQQNQENKQLIISGGIVPHHPIANEIIEKFFQKLSQYQGIENIIILAPDHYRQGEKQGVHFLTATQKENFKINETAINTLVEKKIIGLNEAAVFKDQGISSLLIYLAKYFPKTPIIPVLISPLASQEEVRNFINNLNSLLPYNTIIIGSVDFTHYLSDSLLRLHDVKSIRVLLNFEENEFPNLDVDSWQALYGMRYFAQLKNQEKPLIIGHKTSFDYFNNLPENSQIAKEGGTSYFSAIFEKGEAEKNSNQFSMLIVGDIMMGRGVQKFTDQFGLSYPFENIKNIFKGMDIIFGNLEGPVMEKAPTIPLTSLNFAYPLEVVQELKKLGFNLLTIANNHSLDKGEKVLEQTRNYLLNFQIQPLGDYRSCDEKYYFRYKNILFIGANLVYQNQFCVEQTEKNIKAIKQKDPTIFIIFIPHWGREYVHLPDNFQEETAHTLIDAGADLIVGHHPHVVQKIEEYKGKLIFYSLGNFVFDMYFSKDVQEELGLGIDFKENEVIFYLIPFKSQKSQLSLMKNEERENFLNWLSQISTPSLFDKIKDGIIIYKK